MGQQSLTPQTNSDVYDSYVTAIQQNTATIPDDSVRYGVVRKPMYGLTDVTHTNLPALGPPEQLLDLFHEKREELAEETTETTAHNKAWDDVNFESKYMEYLTTGWENTDSDVHAALTQLKNSVENSDSDSIALICYESHDKQCHRHLLKEFVEQRVIQ